MTVQIYGWFYINNFEFIDIYVHFLYRQETNQRKRPETNASTRSVKLLEIIQK